MIFLNPWMLLGLLGVLVPIILHLIRKQAAKPYEWGAMRFLMDTIVHRRRKMEWEEILLMAARCLIIALAAMALARPLVPPDSKVPWLIILPLVLLGVAALGASFVISSGKFRWISRLVALLLLAVAAAGVYWENFLNDKRFTLSDRRDIALIFDGSTSMTMPRDGATAFERAVDEARTLVKEAPRGTAFTVLLGGPAPELKTATPLTSRADVLEVLDTLRPVEGPFRAHDALGMATISLAQGGGAAKDMIVFTDSQRVGWRLESPAAWTSLGDAWEILSRNPRLMMRSYDLPANLRNVAIAGISTSREVIGTDREVIFQVRVENTGTETVTPGEVSIEVEGKTLEPQAVGQLIPGQNELVEFRHKFKEFVPQVVVATVDAQDDLPADNRFELAVSVMDQLPVLLIDGNPGGSFFDRATGYTALALAPTAALAKGDDPGDHLMDPSVLPAPSISTAEIESQAVIVLADVNRLPANIAERISNFVQNGGGLLILAGEKTDPEFYNGWSGSSGPVLPVALGDMVVLENPVSPAAATFTGQALRLFKDEAGQDLEGATIAAYRSTKNLVKGGEVTARFSDGSPFIASQSYGRGRVMLVTTGFDNRLGNLPVRQSFVPLAHELTGWLAGAKQIKLNVEASWNPALVLSGGDGLHGQYFKGKEKSKDYNKVVLDRIDPAINFDWEGGSPAGNIPIDNFHVEWTGLLRAPKSGNYVFNIEADNTLTVKIDGRTIGNSDQMVLVADQPVSFQATFRQVSGAARARLFWTIDGKKEIVPPSAFVSASGKDNNQVLAESTALDPRGDSRRTLLTAAGTGQLLSVEGAAIPGIYQLDLPPQVQGEFPSNPEKAPLVVSRDIEESRLTTLNEDDLNLIRREFDLVEASSYQDILAVLSGKGFGKELWKILAIAAFLFLLLETALARWVSGSRKMLEETRVDFEDRDKPRAEFMSELEKIKKAG